MSRITKKTTIEKKPDVKEIQHPISFNLFRLRTPECVSNAPIITFENSDVLKDFEKKIYNKEDSKSMVDMSNFAYNDLLSLQTAFG
jgi:hypothetical protein